MEASKEQIVDVGSVVEAVSGEHNDGPIYTVESLCMRCHDNGITRIMLTSIPNFRKILLSAFECPHCGERNNEVQFAGELQPRGCCYTLKLPAGDMQMLNRQVVKSESATIKIPELDFEIPPEAQRGSLSTVEGILTRAADSLEALQEERRKVDPKTAEALDQFLVKLRACATAESSFTFVLADPAGNSFIENPYAPSPDPSLSLKFYDRTLEQQEALGYVADTSQVGEPEEAVVRTENHATDQVSREPHGTVGARAGRRAIAQSNSSEVAEALCRYAAPEEVMTFPITCGACESRCETRMFVTNIPYFKEVIVMASTCDSCGYRNSELKPGGSISDKARRTTACIKNLKDLNRDVIKSDSASVKIPELDLELASGTLGGMVTTVEGLVTKICENLERVHGFTFGDSLEEGRKGKWIDFNARLNKLLSLEEPWTLILDDALANSFIAPVTDDIKDDSQLSTEEYERTWEQVFFTNKTYLPDQTPEPLIKFRKEELEILRGKGKENQMLQEWDRIYDYAYYNDLGEPDKGPEHVRPIFGGSAEFPYPRRGRTSRPRTKTDPLTETRLPVVKSTDVYCPRDEKFNHLKFNDFVGDTVKSISQGIVGLLDAIFDKTPKEFDSFEEVLSMYGEEVGLPDTPGFQNFRKNIPSKFLKSLFRSDGAPILKYPMPDIIKHDKSAWMTDEEFTRQIVSGIHPLIIRRLEEFPPVSKLDPSVYGNQNSSITKECIEKNLNGLSVKEAIQSNKLFILDHHDTVMPHLRKINAETPSKVYATRTLLFLKDDGTLKPLAIELSLPHSKGEKFGSVSKVYTPSSEAGIEASLWLLAKTYVTVTDSAYHQLISHWLHTHAVMEPLIIAANRQLSKLHPIYKLLHPHFRDTMPVNIVARQIALNADGLFEAAVYPRQHVGQWTSALYKDWALTDHALPRDLIKRGMAVKDSKSSHGYKLHIEDYPYAVDGLEIWSAIETWVKEYCAFYYKSDDMVAKDPELQTWWKEIREIGHGDKKDEKWWPEMKTFNELTETCTTIIWVASALHAVVNFGQYPYSGYMPNRPTISRRFMPEPHEYEELKKDPEGFFLKTVTSHRRTLACLSVIELISRHSEDEVYLGQREPGWTSDAPPLEAFEQFSKKLVEIEKRILERNNDPKLKNRVGPAKLPFILLCPSSGVGITGRGIPNSVSI